MPRRSIIILGAYEAPAHDMEGQGILRNLVNAIESEPGTTIQWMDVYFKHRVDTFFQQRIDTLSDLRQVIRSVRRRDRSCNQPDRHRRAIRFLTDICDRYERNGSETAIQRMDDDLRSDGQPRYEVSWMLWNQICRHVRWLQCSDQQHNGHFCEIRRIPNAMIDQFYADLGADNPRQNDSRHDRFRGDDLRDASSGEDSPGDASLGEDSPGDASLGEDSPGDACLENPNASA